MPSFLENRPGGRHPYSNRLVLLKDGHFLEEIVPEGGISGSNIFERDFGGGSKLNVNVIEHRTDAKAREKNHCRVSLQFADKGFVQPAKVGVIMYVGDTCSVNGTYSLKHEE